MPKIAYPTQDDLIALLQGIGAVDNPPSDVQQTLLDLLDTIPDAIYEWETRSGYQPFLADTADTTWYFESDLSSIVDLEGGFVSITSVSLNDVLRVENRDYRAMPRNAVNNGVPITYLAWFLVRPFPVITNQIASVKVIGKRGYSITLREAHWNAILKLAALPFLPDLATLKTDGVIKRQQGDTSYTYAGSPTNHLYSPIEMDWLRYIECAMPRRMKIA